MPNLHGWFSFWAAMAFASGAYGGNTVVTFEAPRLYAAPASAMAAADLNGDGNLDLVCAGLDANNGQSVEILLGRGTAAEAFSPPRKRS